MARQTVVRPESPVPQHGLPQFNNRSSRHERAPGTEICPSRQRQTAQRVSREVCRVGGRVGRAGGVSGRTRVDAHERVIARAMWCPCVGPSPLQHPVQQQARREEKRRSRRSALPPTRATSTFDHDRSARLGRLYSKRIVLVKTTASNRPGSAIPRRSQPSPSTSRVAARLPALTRHFGACGTEDWLNTLTENPRRTESAGRAADEEEAGSPSRGRLEGWLVAPFELDALVD